MLIEFDPRKRARTLARRGLDFIDAAEVFAGSTYRFSDDRLDYGEERTVTIGKLGKRWVVVVSTERGEARRIISMRYANDREIARYAHRVG
jgi:uncharacterized DUF497 family protein